MSNAMLHSDVSKFSVELAALTARERLLRIFEHFGSDAVVFSSSFGAFSAVLCHLVSDVAPGTSVYFLDTGFHFPETLQFRDDLLEKLNLTLRIIHPKLSKPALFALLGDTPYQTAPDRCCGINKVEPLKQILKPGSVWISGLRRGQTDHRTTLDYFYQTDGGHYKIQPILDWSSPEMYRYLRAHQLPVHPLWEKGYTSIGCAPCTAPCQAGGDERSGRWKDSSKTECGLHL